MERFYLEGDQSLLKDNWEEMFFGGGGSPDENYENLSSK